MTIWLALIIPIVCSIILYSFFHHKLVWWEVVLPIVVSIVLIFGMKFAVEISQTRDIEYWGGWATMAEYYEEWTEKVTTTSTDKDGNTTTSTYYVDHDPYWQITDSNGIEVRISQSYYRKLVGMWGNEKEVNIIRFDQSSFGDGDKYVTLFNGKREDKIPVTTIHYYENRVQASHSTFNFPEVDPKKYGLIDYPSNLDATNVSTIYGARPAGFASADREFNLRNAELGRRKQVRMWVLLFVDKPLEAAHEQEAYWKGGNKNEFTVCIGVDRQMNVQWCHVISWTEVHELKIEVRNMIATMGKLDLPKLSKEIPTMVDKKFKRKQFADFSYLTVEPPLWGVLTTFFVTLLVNVGIGVYAVKNDIDQNNWQGFGFGKRRHYNSYRSWR